MASKERNSRSWIHGLECARGCRSLRWHGSHGLFVGTNVRVGRPARLCKADERGAKAAMQAAAQVGGLISMASRQLSPAVFPSYERLDEPPVAPPNSH